ncbi:alpha/beta hydrolase [Agrococcus sp. 1P02AA]|uniref:alpha/beta fold hydrolase n=1 Tax=Agrococcus sp. 1P02AA TaxID=3132259 RepID=UPI0039A6C870
MTPVLALHSLFFDGRMFDDLAHRTGRTIIAPDHRGQGAREGEGGDLSIDALAADTIVELERIGEPVHLVGSSMGAYVAMVATARRPELVRSLVLSAATADAERRPELFGALVAALRAEAPEQRAERIASTMFGQPFRSSGAAALVCWKSTFASRSGAVADAAEQVFARRELWSEMTSITCPTLLLAGAWDTAKSPADMAAISARTGCAAPVVFEQSGHTPFVEEPDQVAAVLAPWWTKIENERKTPA